MLIWHAIVYCNIFYSIQEPKYTKKILKHGDKTTFASKGDRVSCFYTGKLENGVVFDSNVAGAGVFIVFHFICFSHIFLSSVCYQNDRAYDASLSVH